jgi:formylglycine-generating enzyme required for sulfatase activity
MNQRFGNSPRIFLVVVASVLLTSFTIDATDTFRTSQTALGLLASKVTEDTCPSGMVEGLGLAYRFCVDEYEVSVGEDCVIAKPGSAKDTAANTADADCEPVSEAGLNPWTNVAQVQAAALCARAGKRLPSAQEWYLGALGTPDNQASCNLAEGEVLKTGARPECRSGAGAFDMVGNVWELVDGQVKDSVYAELGLPSEGYVAGINEAGVAYKTETEPSVVFNDDYFWSESVGQFVMMRGGFYGSRNDGGVYAVHAKTEPAFASASVGFRCALSL